MRFEYTAINACLCGAALVPDARTIVKQFSRGEIRFVRCANCGSYMQSPRLTQAARAAWFDSPDYQAGGAATDGGYVNYSADEAHRVMEARARYARDLKRVLPERARVLEVGCATGSFLTVLAAAGHDVTGVDLSAEFIKQGQALYPALNLQAGDFLTMNLPDNSFDCVATLGSLITLENANEFFAFAHRVLKPGGWIYFNAPVVDSWLARIYGRHFQPFSPSVCTVISARCVRLLLQHNRFALTKECVDQQRPSLRKMLVYMRLRRLQALAEKVGLGNAAAPFALPAIGVRAFWARKN